MKVLKKYWTHILNLSFLIYTTILFMLMNSSDFNNYDTIKIVILLGILFIYIVGIWVEIIYYMVHAIRNKEIKNNALYMVLNYLFNVWYIPCYSIQFVSKDKNYKIKNMIYLVLSISISIGLFIFMIMYQMNN